jgi:hypothetical protein
MEPEHLIARLDGRRLVLDLPERFENHKVEVTVLTIEEAPKKPRRPHPSIAGRTTILGDLFDSVSESDWGLE